MSGFTIGKIESPPRSKNAWPERTEVSLVSDGIQLFRFNRGFMGGGLGTYTPAQARELGQLLINAADRWAELTAHVRQAEAEVAAVKKSTASRIKDFLA